MKIAIIRLSAFGDVCLFLPALNALRRAYPQAQITWIVGKNEAKLLDGIEGVELVVYDKKSGLRGAFALKKELKNRRFDYLLMAQEALRASILSLFVNADVRLGFDRVRSKDFQRLFCNRVIAPHPNCHMVDNYLDFAAALGVTDLRVEQNLPIPQEAFERAAAIVENTNVTAKNASITESETAKDANESAKNGVVITQNSISIVQNSPIAGNETAKDANGIAKNAVPIVQEVQKTANPTPQTTTPKPYFVLSPTATPVRRNWRNWTAERYAAVVDYAWQSYGIQAVITGTESDREMAEMITLCASAEPINAVSKTDIKTLLALIKNAQFVIAPDSSPGHFAAALGTPAIALIAAADPRRAAPYQTPSYTVERYREALLKFHGQTPQNVKFGTRVRHIDAMKEIKIAHVTAMIDQVMKDKRR